MGLTLDQLVFDPTGPSEGANVGAFLRDSAGNLITSTLLSGHQALDVNVVSSITTTPPSDISPATQNITAQDTGSTSTSGANGQSIITGSPTAGSTASFALSTEAAVRVQVTGIWTGTLQSEISNDGGTTWYPTQLSQDSNPITGPSWSANFEAAGNVAAATNFRIRATAAWTGTATVQVVESLNSAMVYIGNPMKLVDSSSSSEATIKAASTAAAASDTSLVVALSPNSPLPTGSNTIGAVTQGTSPWVDNLTEVGGSAISLGQKASAASFPVVIASDQSAIPVSQSGTWTVQQGTPPWSVVGNIADGTADAGDPVKTGTRASFGAALSAQSATNERSDMISDRYRRLFVSGSADVAVKNTQVSVGTSAITLLASQLQGRRKIYIQNNTSKSSIYLGHDNTVTSSNGLKVAAGAVFEDEVGEDVAIWVISDAASTDVRVYELA